MRNGPMFGDFLMKQDFCAHKKTNKPGFTLLQLLVVISLIAVLSALLFGVFGRGRSAARRSQCELHLKEIAMALDTYRQENGRMPSLLSDLVTKKYVPADTLRCPNDPDLKLHAGELTYSSYSDGYLVREPRDSGELPIVVCPLHEADGNHGVQAYKGRYTTQYTSRKAMVHAGAWNGVVTISRVGGSILRNPVVQNKPLELGGGDRVKTGAGNVTIAFADGSSATVHPNSEMRILDTYIEGQRSGPLYTLVRQFGGRVNYYVNPGSHFDVATPTATAGALGTRFIIDVVADSTSDADAMPDTSLLVTEHSVAFSTVGRTIEVVKGETALVADSPNALRKERRPRRRGSGRGMGTGDKSTETVVGDDDNPTVPNPTPTPAPATAPMPTATPAPVPTPTPDCNKDKNGKCKDDDDDGNNGKGNDGKGKNDDDDD